MSAEDGSITLAFGDGDYPFRIAVGQWRELQESVNKPRIDMGAAPVGPMSLIRSLGQLDAWPHDVREVIRLGLIGGGMKADRALVLVKQYVDGAPLAHAFTAAAILQRAMFGPPDDPVGKVTPSASEPETPAATKSDFLNSTASALQ
jgi:hypothetical protein